MAGIFQESRKDFQGFHGQFEAFNGRVTKHIVIQLLSLLSGLLQGLLQKACLISQAVQREEMLHFFISLSVLHHKNYKDLIIKGIKPASMVRRIPVRKT